MMRLSNKWYGRTASRSAPTDVTVPRGAPVLRLLTLVLGLTSATSLAASVEQRAGAEPAEFRIVRGDGYEGAIVPTSSPWHGMFRIAMVRGRGRGTGVPSDLTAWTPEPSDVAATERYFVAFVERAAKDPSQAIAALPTEDRPAVENGLPWLIANVRTLKRQYWGFRSGDVRRIAVHGAPDDPAHRWRFEGRAIIDGGCGNFWLDFNLTEQRIVRFTCGGNG